MKTRFVNGAVMAATTALVVAFSMTTGSVSVSAQDKKDSVAKDPVVATVNGEKIHLSELRAMHQEHPFPRVRAMGFARIYRPLLELTIQTRLLAAAAKKAKLDEKANVKQRVEHYKTRILHELYLNDLVDKRAKDGGLKTEYEAWKKTQKPQVEISARHILVKSEKEALAIIDELKKGKDFAKLAAEKSIGPSKARGGSLGWFGRRQMVKPFSNAAFKLEKGKFTETPVKTQFGWHIIKVDDKRNKPLPSLQRVRGQMRQRLMRKVNADAVKTALKDAKIERFNPDGSAVKKAPTKKAPEKKPEKK